MERWFVQDERSELELESGKKVQYEYDSEGDILEIIFQRGSATCAVELTDSIILHFDWETVQPLSLTLISFSHLIQPTEHGAAYFQLLVDEHDEEAQEKVWQMLESTPLNTLLKVGGFTPTNAYKTLPVARVNYPSALPLGV